MPTISNWSRTQHCTPTRIVHPRDEQELLALVREARATGTTVKVVGARHSWSDIAMTNQTLVSLDAMQQLLAVDEVRGHARVQAGIRIHQLNTQLHARGLALPIVGSVTEQSLAGVMSTGTHGSSLVHGNIPSFVVGARLITGAGELLVLDEDHPWLPAVRVGLGALGILTEITIRVVPAFQLCETTETVSFASAVESVQDIARSAEFVKLWWLPHTEGVIVFRYERTDRPCAVSKLGRWVDQHVINDCVFRMLLALGGRFPGITPTANRAVARTYFKPRTSVGRSDLMLSLVMPPRHREVEYALPLEHTGEAMLRTRALIEQLGVRVNFLSEVRFVKADTAWMSPASERDSCQVGAYMAAAPGIDAYFSGFEQAMQPLGGRPHWGKEFSVGGSDLREMYPRAEQFAALVRELDPDGVLRNPFLDRVLGVSTQG
jgi:FAD/FMN-containing dehydrogenase